jgi:hypothetical protein
LLKANLNYKFGSKLLQIYFPGMKNHFSSLIDPSNRSLTLRYFMISVVLIAASKISGINDNLIGIVSLVTGVCSLFYSLVHTWKKGRSYAILAWMCAAIMALTFAAICILSWLGFEKYLGEAVIMFIIFFICLPGIIVGILGAVLND